MLQVEKASGGAGLCTGPARKGDQPGDPGAEASSDYTLTPKLLPLCAGAMGELQGAALRPAALPSFLHKALYTWGRWDGVCHLGMSLHPRNWPSQRNMDGCLHLEGGGAAHCYARGPRDDTLELGRDKVNGQRCLICPEMKNRKSSIHVHL